MTVRTIVVMSAEMTDHVVRIMVGIVTLKIVLHVMLSPQGSREVCCWVIRPHLAFL
jgi:hypothetical protein